MNNSNAEKVLKTIFGSDFRHFVDYMDSMGLDPNEEYIRTMTEGAFIDSKKKKYTYLDPARKDVMMVNEPLFAFYMLYHISNNAFDMINGTSLSYKGVMDQVKRMGPQNKPVISFDTNTEVNGNYVGSLATTAPVLNIKDIKVEPYITEELKAVVDALDGSSLLSPLQRRMFDISTGGSSYSITGDTSMIKTLGLFVDPVSGRMTQIKHAAKYITESDFNSSPIYKRLVMDLFKAQDQWLAKNKTYQEVVKGTRYQDYSWYDHFIEYFNKTQSMDKAIDMLFEDLVVSQYAIGYLEEDENNFIDTNGQVRGKEEFRAVHRNLYSILASSVVYGYNPESVTKTTATSINNYDPTNAERLDTFSFGSIDYTGMGIVNSSDQPMDDSKKQPPYSQIIGLLGYGNYKLSGKNGNPGSENTTVAILNKQNELYYEGMRLINAEIDAIVPTGVDYRDGMPKFSEVNWYDVDGDTRDLSYALAQLETFMRKMARAGMIDADVQGNYIEMLSDMNISRQFPQMRNKMLQTYRNYINTHAIKRGMNGMRATQASGVFHRFYYLKGEENGMPYTRREALEHINIFEENLEHLEETEERLAEKFDIRGLDDMRVVNGQTKRGQVVMPYVYGKALGLRMKGEDGATHDETLRDLFSINTESGKINIRDVAESEIEDILRNENLHYVEDSPLVRAAFKNVKARSKLTHLRNDEFLEENNAYTLLAEEISTLRDSAIATLKVFAVRTPSNGLGNGAWYDIVGFHGDGNVIYIPVGMTLLNDSDFDIDQLAIYFKKLNKEGHLLTDRTNNLFNDILDITEEFYLAKENQPDIFVESSIKLMKEVANKEEEYSKPTPFNSAYSLLKSYNENRTGDKAIGILVNTLSAAVYLSIFNDINKKIVPGTRVDNPMSVIVDKARKEMRGKESLIIMVGDWLQAALDNPKENVLGKYGVIEEAIPVLGILIARGPRKNEETGKMETTEEFFQRIKDFFNEYTIRNTFADEALNNSLYKERGTNTLYASIQRHLANVKSNIENHPIKSVEGLTTKANQKVIDDFVKENMLSDINQYYREVFGYDESEPARFEMNDDMSRLEREELDNTIWEYIKSVDKHDDSADGQRKKAIAKEYIKLTNYYELAYNRLGLETARKMLEELDELVVQAEALRNVSRLVSLRQGLPGKDSDRAFLIKKIELMFGADIETIAESIETGSYIDEEGFKNYFMEHSNEYILSDDMNQAIVLDRAVRVFRMVNLWEYVRSNPATRVHIRELIREKNIRKNMFFVDSDFYTQLEDDFVRQLGLNEWKHPSQWSTFMEAFSSLATDRYFDKYWNKTISIAIPTNVGGRFIPGEGILSQLNLSNIHHRELFSLMFPEMIDLLQSEYESAEEMESAFTAVSPDFAGISKAFFNQDGIPIPNAFVNMLVRVGSNERYYAGFERSTSEISDEARLRIQEDFNVLPPALKELFLANEIIANKMHYKKGSIGDAIGIDIFKKGLSKVYNEFHDDVINGEAFRDSRARRMFNAYVSTLSGMTTYVNEDYIGYSGVPVYFHSYRQIRGNSIMVHNEKGILGPKPIYHLTPRAGVTMNERYPVISELPFLLLTGEELVALEDTDASITKLFVDGHGYRKGYYLTEMGRSAYVEPNGNIIKISNGKYTSGEVQEIIKNKREEQEDLREQEMDALIEQGELIPPAPSTREVGYGEGSQTPSHLEYDNVVLSVSGETLEQFGIPKAAWDSMTKEAKENIIRCN